MAQGRANGLQGLVTAVARALGMGHGDANAPGMAHGAGKGPARGGGFGFGHTSVGNPGHNALSTKSSHSQNNSDKGGTHDGRSFSSHSHSTQSLAQHQSDHSKKADQVVQVEDRGPGKEKGIVDSRPPGQGLQPDRGKELNQDTIHSNLDDIVTLGLPPGQEVQPDRGMTLNLEMIHSNLDEIVTRALKPGQELQADPGGALNLETIHSDFDNIVTLGLPPSQELQADRVGTLNPGTIDSNIDDIVSRGLPLGLELSLHRGKSLSASLQAEVAPGTIVPDTDDTPATALSRPWEVGDDRAKVLPSTNLGPEGDHKANARWKLVFGAALLFFSWILQSGLAARKRKAARLKFESNALRPIGSVNGASSAGARQVAAAFSIADERHQKAAEEKKGAVLGHFSGDPDVEKATAEIEHAQEIEETFRKDFNGIGLS